MSPTAALAGETGQKTTAKQNEMCRVKREKDAP